MGEIRYLSGKESVLVWELSKWEGIGVFREKWEGIGTIAGGGRYCKWERFGASRVLDINLKFIVRLIAFLTVMPVPSEVFRFYFV